MTHIWLLGPICDIPSQTFGSHKQPQVNKQPQINQGIISVQIARGWRRRVQKPPGLNLAWNSDGLSSEDTWNCHLGEFEPNAACGCDSNCMYELNICAMSLERTWFSTLDLQSDNHQSADIHSCPDVHGHNRYRKEKAQSINYRQKQFSLLYICHRTK